MNKISAIVITCSSLFSVYASAGSLDVHGEIKVNGTTVIDAQGNYVGTLPSQVDSIELDPYLNPTGIKKTYTQTQTTNGQVQTGTRVDDYTTANIIRFTYKWPDQGSVYTSTETYYTPTQWIEAGVNCAYDPATSNESSCTNNYYWYSSYQKTTVYWQDKIQAGGSFLESYRQTSTVFYCNSGGDTSSVNGPCTITGSDYLGDNHNDPVVTNFNQVVMVLNRLAFKNDTVSYDDCVALQFNGTNETPWTAIYCKDIGMVKGWSNNGYSLELTSVEGTATTSTKSAPSLSLRAMAPVTKK